MEIPVWKARMTPFKVIGNLYFVGTIPASAHLIDTGDGLILLDSGYPIYYAFLIKCVRFIQRYQKPKLTPMLVKEK